MSVQSENGVRDLRIVDRGLCRGYPWSCGERLKAFSSSLLLRDVSDKLHLFSRGTSVASIHNPDQYMAALRMMVAQGRKRIGLLVGAGGPAGLKADDGSMLIPAVAGLTTRVIKALDQPYSELFIKLKAELPKQDIESLLSRVRALSAVLGTTTMHGLDAEGFRVFGDAICSEIGNVVKVRLPPGECAYTDIVAWITGSTRAHAVEVFTTNYDLLFEEAFERAHSPYFDGFSGGREAFFDPATVASGNLPPRWTRLWKLHGSLGWKANDKGEVVRTGEGGSSHLVFPQHLKYEQTQKAPYTALLDRLRSFVGTPDTLLITVGFSFSDAHIAARIDEALAASPSSSVFAFQFNNIEEEVYACEIARRRPNFCVYARECAMVNGVTAKWEVPHDLPSKDWGPIRESYWGPRSPGEPAIFRLGAIDAFARFLAASRSPQAFDGAANATVSTNAPAVL